MEHEKGKEPWSDLRVGQKVTIFFDPLTEKEVEEERVKLIAFRYSGGWWNGRKVSWWIVQFSDRQKCFRKILEPEVIAGEPSSQPST